MNLQIQVFDPPERVDNLVFFRFIGTALDGKLYHGWILTNPVGDVNAVTN